MGKVVMSIQEVCPVSKMSLEGITNTDMEAFRAVLASIGVESIVDIDKIERLAVTSAAMTIMKTAVNDRIWLFRSGIERLL